MLRVDPNERVDIVDVVSYCEKQLAIIEENRSKEKGDLENSTGGST
jgi:hypothetical protein